MSKEAEAVTADSVLLMDTDNNDSPYYTDTHRRFRAHCRQFVKKEVLPYIDKWSKQGSVPKEFWKKVYKAGIYSRWYPKFYGGTPWEGSLANSFDPFLTIIFEQEFAKAGSGGLMATGWIHGLVAGPVLLHGNDKQREMMRPVISADKFSALCVSEPGAGSDVKNIKTTARKEGKHYIVNGEKFWITGGMSADLFLVACQTIEEGSTESKGISLLLIERGPGVITTRLPLQGHDCSATAYVVFRNVKVPEDMVVGKPKEGFKNTMRNFNQERFGIICLAVGLARVCVEDSVRYALSRNTFGKPLIQHQVIRHKLAEMARQTLASNAFLEQVAYRIKQKPFSADAALIRDVSLLKVQATRTLEFCAREASQIFGGRSYVRGGRAGKIERIYRDVRALSIYGGSEEIMLDLAIKQSKL